MPSRFHRYAPIAYLLLASIYLLYLPHVEFVLDDWLVLGRYEVVREAGASETLKTGLAVLRNQFHNQFRFQWLSYGSVYLLSLAVGYSPKFFFVLFLMLHAASAMVWRSVLERMGLGTGLAFLTGALFVLLPSAHGPVFWPHNCCYYILSTLWFFLYLRSLVTSLKSERLGGREAAQQVGFLLLALFSGDPVFALLLAGAPLAGWFLRSKVTVRATALAWATIGVAVPIYALLINGARVMGQGIGLRYRFTPANAWNMLLAIADTYRRLAGFGERSFYHFHASWATLGAAAIAVAATAVCLRGLVAAREHSTARILTLAAALWLAAYGPIWFLGAHEFRYDYVPSPYLALAMATVAMALPVARKAAAVALVGWAAMATVADIRQCWTPQSEELHAVGRRLREIQPLERGDLIVVSNAPLWIGTAPHFAMMAGWASDWFAAYATGVRGLETACDIVNEGGRLRSFHYDRMRDLRPEDLARTHVLVEESDGRLNERRLLAMEARPGMYRLYPLKGYAGPPVPAGPVSREQLALEEGAIYFARAFSHGRHRE